MKPENVVRELLSKVGVRVNGSNPWDIQVNDARVYARVLRDKSLGLGESYMDGWWECERIDELIRRILSAELDSKILGSWKLLLPYMKTLVFNTQSKSGAREVAERHYDLGNDLFMSFLDPYNQYSCAYFNGSNDLRSAQRAKMDLICKKLCLRPEDHLLDIGFGWGGLAKYAAETVGCTVTGVNISDEQVAYAKKSCRSLPIHIRHCDYRSIDDVFDKIVSVGMFEHVGVKNYRTFFQVAARSLKDKGSFLLQTIGGNTSRLGTDPWINKYIFPNGKLPSIAQIAQAAEGLLIIEDIHNIGPHYDKTLMAWYANFQDAWPSLSGAYDTRFKRMWEFYLLSCAGAFRARDIQLWQILMTKPGTKQPTCRF